MECLPVAKLPEGPEWTYEINFQNAEQVVIFWREFLFRFAVDDAMNFYQVAWQLALELWRRLRTTVRPDEAQDRAIAGSHLFLNLRPTC
jgi:hypothetical protein